jgi:DNA-directed RNA polymerase specialized sigma24 family protein
MPQQPIPISPAGATPYSDGAVATIYTRILRSCLAAGLAFSDAEDVAQDVWIWLLRTGSPILALTAPWLGAVVHYYVLRYRRRSATRRRREGVDLEAIAEPGAPSDETDFETREALDRIAADLPDTERRLFLLIRQGHTLARAAALLGIPRGSCAYHGGRLVRLARASMGGRRDEWVAERAAAAPQRSPLRSRAPA